MTAAKTRTFKVQQANQETVEITATRAEESEGGRLKFYDGDDLVASFAGHQGFYPAPA